MTNFENLRKAPLEEIARILYSRTRCNYCAYHKTSGWLNTIMPCQNKKEATYKTGHCMKGIKEWLRSEVNE